MPLPTILQTTIDALLGARIDYNRVVIAGAQADAALAQAQQTKAEADSAITASASTLGASVTAFQQLLESFKPGNTPPADPV